MGKIYVTAHDGGVREGDGEVRSEMHTRGDVKPLPTLELINKQCDLKFFSKLCRQCYSDSTPRRVNYNLRGVLAKCAITSFFPFAWGKGSIL